MIVIITDTDYNLIEKSNVRDDYAKTRVTKMLMNKGYEPQEPHWLYSQNNPHWVLRTCYKRTFSKDDKNIVAFVLPEHRRYALADIPNYKRD